MEYVATEEQSLEYLVLAFHVNHVPQTLHAYLTDLVELCTFYQGQFRQLL
jgi:hypothetical protein